MRKIPRPPKSTSGNRKVCSFSTTSRRLSARDISWEKLLLIWSNCKSTRATRWPKYGIFSSISSLWTKKWVWWPIQLIKTTRLLRHLENNYMVQRYSMIPPQLNWSSSRTFLIRNFIQNHYKHSASLFFQSARLKNIMAFLNPSSSSTFRIPLPRRS